MDRLKKYETGIVGSFLLSLLLLFSSCQNTGLMYDVSQPGTVYFVKTGIGRCSGMFVCF